MKTKQLLPLLFAFCVAGSAAAQMGGPDAFGYEWKDNTASGGPAVVWKDIKGIGTKITGLQDDNSKGPFNIGWSFRYYWSNYNKIKVGSNGWISFDVALDNIAAPFPAIPATNAKNTVSPLLCDLTFVKGTSGNPPVPQASAWYWSNNADTFIVQYDSVPFWVNNPQGFSGLNSFQIILSGVDSSITFQYKIQQDGTPPYDMVGEGLYSGITNSTGQIGLQVLDHLFPLSNSAVKFYYPNPVTYQVFDVAPAWNQVPDNAGFFISSGSSHNLITDIANVGNQPVLSFGIDGEVRDNTFNAVWTSSTSAPSLPAGGDIAITFPAPFTPSAAGIYTYRSMTKLPADINGANDINDVEMVAVDTTQPSISLSFSEATSATTGLSWQGGNGGGGVYFMPPFYPAVIESIDHFILSYAGTKGFSSVLRADNGPGKSVGTTIDSVKVPHASVSAGAYNNVPLSAQKAITSGGVYAAWYMGGDSMALGTDGAFPISNRNYEIIGGGWASYRGNASADLMMKLNIRKFGDISVATTADGCPTSSSGSATVSITGGKSPFTYVWNTTPAQSSATATGLAAGTYTVDITDATGVMISQTATILNTVTVSVTANSVSCFGSSDGSVSATVGGAGPYTFMWSNGQTSSAATGLGTGVYTVTATNGAGCMNTASDTVKGPAMIVPSFSVTASSCVGNTGSATASAVGGTGAYTYVWSTTPAQSTATATGLSAGSYTLSVYDANGCANATLVGITQTPFNVTASTTTVSCFNGSNGTATANPTTGGTAPYTFAWSSTPVQTTATATGLSPGTYSVLVTDSKGCTKTVLVTLANPNQININISSQPASCATCPNGKATAAATAGVGPYTYAWNTTPVQTTGTATGLLPGTYSVCVTDSKGCTNCKGITVVDNTGVNEITGGASIVISPNPFNTSANVKIDFISPSHNGLTFVVYDLYGRAVQSIDLGHLKGTVVDFTLNRGSNVPGGVYFYKLIDEQSILTTGKIVVQ